MNSLTIGQPLTLQERFAPYIIVLLHLIGAGSIDPSIAPLIVELGGLPWVIGLSLASFGAGNLLSSVPGGIVGDHIGPRATVIVGLCLMALSGFLLGIVPGIAGVIIGMVVQGMGLGIYVPNLLSILQAATERRHYGKTMSTYTMVGQIGFVVGPALGGMVVMIVGLRGPFYLYGLMCTLALLVAISSLPRVVREHVGAGSAARSIPRPVQVRQSLAQVAVLREPIKASLVSLISMATRFGLVLTVLALFYAEVAEYSPAQIGLVFSAHAFGIFVLSAISGPISDRVSRKRIIIVGSCLQTATIAVIPVLTHPILALVINFLFGASLGILRPVLLAYVADTAPRDQAAMTMGLFQALSGGGQLIGPLFVGIIATFYGPTVPFFAVAVLALIGIGLSLSLRDGMIGEPVEYAA